MRVGRPRPPPPLAGTPLARMQERVVLLDPHWPCIPSHLSLLVMLFYFLLFACTTHWSFLLSFSWESRHCHLCFLLHVASFPPDAITSSSVCLIRRHSLFAFLFFLLSSHASHPRATLQPTATLRQQKRSDKDTVVGWSRWDHRYSLSDLQLRFGSVWDRLDQV